MKDGTVWRQQVRQQQQQGDGTEGEGTGDYQPSNAEWAQLRRATKERDDALRDAAFLRAGIDPDDPRMGYFVRGYTGKLDAAQIKAEAVAAGFLTPSQQDQAAAQAQAQEQAQRQAEVQTSQAISDVASGGMIGEPTGIESERAALQKAMDEGGTEAVAAYLQRKGIPVETPTF